MRVKRLVCCAMAWLLCLTGLHIPRAVAEENTFSTPGTLVETGRDNGYSGSNEIKTDNIHYGWSLGTFTVSGYVRKEDNSYGVTTYYIREGDTGFKLSYKLNYDINHLNDKDTLSINDDTNGYDPAFNIEKQDFGYGALFIRRCDIITGEFDETNKRLNFLYARKPGSSFVVTNSMIEGDYDIALDYEIKEKYGPFGVGVFTNWWNYKVTYRFAVRYIDEEEAAAIAEKNDYNAANVMAAASETGDTYKLITRSSWFEDAKPAGTETGDDGSLIEYFVNEKDNTTVTMVATTREDIIEIPYIDIDTKIQEYLKRMNLEDYKVIDEDETSVRFQYKSEGQTMYARAKAYWTDHFVLIILTEKADASLNDQWMDSLQMEEIALAGDAGLTSAGTRSHVWEIWTSNALTIQKLFAEENMIAIKEPWRHGFAAEHATMLVGRIRGIFTGERIEYTGANNVANGADFTIRKGNTTTLIQAKYYNSARNSIEACFDDTGAFRYLDANGSPMCIEVPKDQYNEAVNIMRTKIQQGKIPGVSNPDQASEIIREGTVSYKQAVNLAKAGTVESLTYDAIHGCVAASSAFGVSALVDFAVSCWNGAPIKDAITNSVFTGLRVGGAAFIVSVVSGQLSKSALSHAMIPASKAIVNALGPKAAAVFVNAFRPAGAAIYGAAAKQAAQKLLRGNVIVSAVSLIVFTVPDIVEAFRGNISTKQLIKNTVTTVGGIAGGAGGAWAGAAAGTAISPGVGTVIGGIIGSLLGGIGGYEGVDAIADLITEDDANEMMEIVCSEYMRLGEEYLLSEEEGERVSVLLQKKIDGQFLKQVYASKNREETIDALIEPLIAEEAGNREIIMLPDIEIYSEQMVAVLETIEDEAQ